jgi:hypothetical protein
VGRLIMPLVIAISRAYEPANASRVQPHCHQFVQASDEHCLASAHALQTAPCVSNVLSRLIVP